jgi:hypothetical protein
VCKFLIKCTSLENEGVERRKFRMANKLKAAAVLGSLLLFSIAAGAAWIPGLAVQWSSLF